MGKKALLFRHIRAPQRPLVANSAISAASMNEQERTCFFSKNPHKYDGRLQSSSETPFFAGPTSASEGWPEFRSRA
ncbi:Hypothetical protein NTJ_05523 [Nesidiocoris tenuis]|uniref:Uncharacterized protein n=1 Tax=Nesidiocoris tenuis TaxID=355587 RepID=A0ABN7AN92_9HEMI|nr:Hypothetical protein NTJ_05523 [Nesidiocoris tenuis]